MNVTVRPIHEVPRIAAVADFFSDVWQTPRSTPPYPAEVLHSLVHAGGAVHAAYTRAGELCGAAVAVFGEPAARDVYSFVAAARTSDRGVGLAVKQAQREWALARGARTMRWTFDPLVGRNARFNLVKLGATGTEYLVDFYGPMADGVNDGDESDRLTVTWDLTADTARAEPVAPAGAVLATAPDGDPLALGADGVVHCRVPADVVKLRAADPALALRWRHAVREVFTQAFADGYAATGMSRDGWYTLTERQQHKQQKQQKRTPMQTQEKPV
ncbi:chorismate synthase [Streptomyces sp. SID14478]|uniref:chorismate synthase n=1 Tax=Streptomyces sp. SID14478 TaxID=2706073 RepID=UPI001EF374AE|nr:chorismate synthase [Streptomyces sp. SID14478]